jgi:hypothetical protein
LGVGGVLAVTESVFSGRSCARTYSHFEALKRLLKYHRDWAKKEVVEAVEYVLEKKRVKMGRKFLGVLPVAGSLGNSIYTLGRTIYKKSKNIKGVKREKYAKTLWGHQLNHTDTLASVVCRELLGGKTFDSIRGHKGGWRVLKKKMRSL